MTEIEEVLQQGIREGSHTGAQVVVLRRGETVADLAVGEARPGMAMTTETPLLWMSSGKPLLAVALGRLVERGLLGWGDVVARHVPEFARHGKDKVTVAHLLTHTAGLTHADRIEANHWQTLVEKMCDLQMEAGWEPGERGAYHTGGTWSILGEVLRRIDGRMPDTYLREEIFQPLGMGRSRLGCRHDGPEPLDLRPAPLFDTFRGAPGPHARYGTYEDLQLPRPGRNAFGPARELARFYGELLEILGGREDGLVRPGTLREMVRRQRRGMRDRTFAQIMDFGYGFILNSESYDPGKCVYGYGEAASAETFGHGGAQSSCAFADPERGLAVVWVANGMPGEARHQRRLRAVNAAVYRAVGGA